MRAAVCLGLAVALAFLTLRADAVDLMTAYRDALANDANFLAARSALDAARESVPIARAGLLPQVTLNAQRTYNQTTNRQTIPTGPALTRHDDYSAGTGALSLRQPLFRMASWAQLSMAEAQVAAAEAVFEKERQDAGLRVAGAYFDVLLAQSQVSALEAQLQAMTGQQRLAERALAAGHGTRTDIDEARARVEQAKATLVVANYHVDNMRRALGSLIGRAPSTLADVVPTRLALVPAQPALLDHWMQQMETGNPELATLRRQVDMAAQDVEKQRAGHYPTLDLIAARQYGSNESNISINVNYATSYIGVQFSAPIYSGGSVAAAVRQTQANLEKARYVLEANRQRLSADTQRFFYGVAQGVDRVQAFDIALQAAEQALVSIRRGSQAGTHTQVDVLNALQRVAEGKRALAQARYDFLMNRLRLAATTGQLDDEQIASINSALREP